MTHTEIPRDQWAEFLRSWSLQHQGWLVDVEMHDEDWGEQLLARDMALGLVSIDFEDGESTLLVTLREPEAGVEPQAGAPPHTESLRHIVVDPERLWTEHAPGGPESGLAVEGRDGIVTVVRFASAMHPEEVDGAVRP